MHFDIEARSSLKYAGEKHLIELTARKQLVIVIGFVANVVVSVGIFNTKRSGHGLAKILVVSPFLLIAGGLPDRMQTSHQSQRERAN